MTCDSTLAVLATTTGLAFWASLALTFFFAVSAAYMAVKRYPILLVLGAFACAILSGAVTYQTDKLRDTVPDDCIEAIPKETTP